MQLSFIVNLQSGNFKGRKVWQKVSRDLKIPYAVYETTHKGHVTELVLKLAQNKCEQLVVVIGGDGTIHEAVNGAYLHEHLTLGYMKAGSGNDFARAFTYFENATAIEAFVRNAQSKLVDCGETTFNGGQSKKFINNFGIGFDAYISKLVNESQVKKVLNKVGLGKLSYAYFVAQGLIRFNPFTLTLQTDEGTRTFQDVWFVTASNQPYFGGGMNLSPMSKVDDGLIEITVVNHLPRLKFLILFLTVFAAAHTKFKAVTQLQTVKATFTTDALLPIHTDGETEMLKQGIIHCTIHGKSVAIAKK